MKEAPTRDQMKFLGESMIVVGDSECLGYLMNFQGRGVYDATYGKVDVTEEESEIHNAALDQAMLKGLDESCKIGQMGTFYLTGNGVTTFLGTKVADAVVCGKSISFTRAGKTYRGRVKSDAQCFNFKRIQ